MKALVNTSRTFHYLAPAVDSAITGKLVLPSNTLQALVVSQLVEAPEVFRLTVPGLALGQYGVRVLLAGTTVWSDHLDVGSNATSDYPLGVTDVYIGLDAAIVGAVDETVTARLVNPAGEFLVDGDGVPLAPVAAAFHAASYTYQFAHTFDVADTGDWGVVWLWEAGEEDGPYIHHVTNLLLCRPTGQELIRFVAADGATGTGHADATIVVSDEALAQVAQGVTDQNGKLQLALFPGTYWAHLVKEGRVFSLNNFSFTVDVDDTGKGKVHLLTAVMVVTATPPASVASMCLLYVDIYRMDGVPLRHATIKISLQHRPQLFSGTAVFDTDMSVLTDSNGHAEVSLVRGIQVEVLIAPLSLRRIITVPAESGPVNLLTLLSAASDLFDIIVPNIPTAAKRAL